MIPHLVPFPFPKRCDICMYTNEHPSQFIFDSTHRHDSEYKQIKSTDIENNTPKVTKAFHP